MAELKVRPEWWGGAIAASSRPALTRTRLRQVQTPVLARDAAPRRKRRSSFEVARLGEASYARRLRAVADNIDEMVRQVWDEEDPARSAALASGMLRQYAKMLDPWARAVARRMLKDVSTRDAKAWREHAKRMGTTLSGQMLGQDPVSMLMRSRLDEQVQLITSLPEEAAKRVHAMTFEGLSQGVRASEIAERVLRTGHVTRARANLIARTEVGRASSELVRARAEYLGSDGYVWRTAHDADVRDLHRELEGTYHTWNDPPVAGERGERAHPGAIYNCRCWAEPVLARR